MYGKINLSVLHVQFWCKNKHNYHSQVVSEDKDSYRSTEVNYMNRKESEDPYVNEKKYWARVK